MSEVMVEVIFILALILINGLLSLTELALVSVRRARLQQRASDGDLGARRAINLIEQPNTYLAAVQIGITLVGILAGTFSGATIAEQLTLFLVRFPSIAPYAEALSIGIVVLVITYFSLVLGELAPKRLALNNPERIAASLSGFMQGLIRFTSPIARFLNASTGLVIRIMGVQPTSQAVVTEEEIKVLIEEGTQAGVFETAEQDMVTGVFRLSDRRVDTIMTPRTEITWLDLDDSNEVNQQKIIKSIHALFPIGKESLDNVLGIVQAKDLLADSMIGKPFNLLTSLIEPVFVPESMPALKVLELFKESPLKLALVIDEFGGLQGLITLTDILEAIVGEILVTGEPDEPEIIQREDGSWLLDGLLPIDEFKDLFHLVELPEEETANYQTLGGFVMTYLGQIPIPSDYFEWGGLRIEVVDMDGFRVDKVLVIVETTSKGIINRLS